MKNEYKEILDNMNSDIKYLEDLVTQLNIDLKKAKKNSNAWNEIIRRRGIYNDMLANEKHQRHLLLEYITLTNSQSS